MHKCFFQKKKGLEYARCSNVSESRPHATKDLASMNPQLLFWVCLDVVAVAGALGALAEGYWGASAMGSPQFVSEMRFW